jgi:hypothetical protein
MSHSTGDYEVRRVVDSRIAVHQAKILAASDGPASVTFRQITPPDPSSLNPVFTIQSPSFQTGIGREVRWKMRGSVVITGTNLNQLTTSNKVAFRSFPLQSCCSSIQLQINDTTISLGSLNQYLAGLTKLGMSSASMAQTTSSTPCAPDLFAEYTAAVGAAGPFEPPAESQFSNDAAGSRTMGIESIALSGGNTVATIVFEVSEPLILSPFSYTEGALSKALYGVNTAQVTCNMSNLHRLLSLSIDGGATVASVALAPTYQSLEVSFVTPHDRSLVERPLSYAYSMASVNFYSTQLTAAGVAARATITGSSNTVELPVIPNQLIIFASYSESDRADPTQSLADMFMPLESIQMTMGSRGGLLSGASSQQLWEMTLRNGGSCPYWLWAGLTQFGSATAAPTNAAGWPLIIDVAADLSLPDGVTPGMNQRISFSITQATYRNKTAATITAPRMIILAVTDGILHNEGGSSMVTLGGVPDKDDSRFLNADMVENVELAALARDSGYGGGFMDFLKAVGHGAMKVLKAGPEIAAAVAPELAPAAMAVKSAIHALGGRKNPRGGAMLGGAMLGGRKM